MLRYEQIADKAKDFLAMTGYTQEEFLGLLPQFQQSYDDYLHEHTIEGYDRVGQIPKPYHNSPLPTIEDKLLFILVYLKQNPTQTLHGYLFEMSQSNVNKWFHLLHAVLNRALEAHGALPEREMTIEAVNAEEAGPQGHEIGAETRENTAEMDNTTPDDTLFFHDGVERPINRPCDPDEQQVHYSGKKKQHTVKNVLVADIFACIRCLSATWEGKCHDKRVADGETYQFPPGSTLGQDMGFQGFEPEGIIILQPKKKPRGGELTAEEKEENRRINSIRVLIEHVISSVKRYRIVKDKFRLWREGIHDMIMETCCGLHNFRLRYRPWRKLSIES